MALTASKPRIADQVTKPTGILTKQDKPVVTSTNKIYSHELTGVDGPTPGGGGSPQSGSGLAPSPTTTAGAPAAPSGGATFVDQHGDEHDGGVLDALQAQAILDAIAQIEASTGLTREQLLADQSAIGQQYRMYMAVAERQQKQNAELVQNQAVERGLARSGIHAKQQADLLQQFIEFQNQQALAQERQLNTLDNQIAQVDVQENQLVAQAIQERAGQTLDLEAIKAAATGGV